MKRALITSVLGLVIITGSMAQGGPSGEKVKQMKIAFITEKLDLSVEESQKFWPVYNELENEKEELKAETKRVEQTINSKSNPSSSDVETAVKQLSELKRQEISLHEQFALDCLPILGPEKTRRMLGAEEQFRKVLLEEIQKRRQNRMDGGNRPGRR